MRVSRQGAQSAKALQSGRIAVGLMLAALAFSACAGRIDLLPMADSGADLSAWCNLDGEGRLLIRIRNQGNRMSIATTTLVQFDAGPPIVLPTRPVLPGQSQEVRLRPDESCLLAGCRFTIQADARQEVSESDESNNLVSGACR